VAGTGKFKPTKTGKKKPTLTPEQEKHHFPLFLGKVGSSS
jgi:hypothetical protein